MRSLLTIAAVGAALAAVFGTLAGGVDETNPGRAPHAVRDAPVPGASSSRSTALLEGFGLDRALDAVPAAFADRFDRELATRAAERGADADTIAFVTALVPRAIGVGTLHDAIGRRLDARLAEASVETLVALHDDPLVAGAMARSRARDPDADPDGFADFVRGLGATPLPGERGDALGALVDVLGTDRLAVDLFTRVQRGVITVAGASAPDRHSAVQQRRTAERIAEVRAAAPALLPAARTRAVHALAWAHEDVDVAELRQLHGRLDVPAYRELVAVAGQGLDDLIGDSVRWIDQRLLRRTAPP